MEHIKDYMNEILLSNMESNDGMQAETNNNLEYDINYKINLMKFALWYHY